VYRTGSPGPVGPDGRAASELARQRHQHL